MKGRTAVVLGVPVDDVTMGEAVEWICDFVEVGRQTGRTHQVATVNADFVVNTFDDPDGLSVLQRTELSIPDGMPIVWGSKLLGAPLRERVPGVDLLPALAAAAAAKGYTIYLFGAAPGVADRAAAMMREEHPNATIVADAGPKLGPALEMDAEALDTIRRARPGIICVALGNPKQERWIARHRHDLGVPVLIGVGGTYDLLVGEKRRAPAWVGSIGMEWVFRAIQEPRRLVRRYLHDIVTFVPRLGRQAWAARPSKAAARRPADVSVSGSSATLRARGALIEADVHDPALDAALVSGGRIVVDLSAVPFVDNRTASALTHLARSAWRAGAEVYLTGVTAGAADSLDRLRLGSLIPNRPED